MKHFFLPLALLLALALLAGCGAPAAQEAPDQSGAPSESAPSPEAPEPVEIDESEAVTLVFSGGSVSVQGADKDTVKVEGAAVTIREGGTYILSGKSDAGSVKVKKDAGRVILILRNLELTADGTAAICCNKGSSLSIVAEEGTVNTLADTAANNSDSNPDNRDAEDAVVKCKNGDLDFSGAGTLNIVANAKNGVKSGQDTGETEAFLTVNALELNVTAVNDGIKSDGAMYLQSGSIRVSAADDAVSSDTAVYIGGEGSGGPVLSLTGCTEGVEAPWIDVCSGDISIEASDDGLNASKTDTGAGIHIRGGRLFVDAANGDGVDSNGMISVTGGDLEIFSSARADNSPLDCGNGFNLSGGTVLAVGAAGMAQSPNETGGQCYLSFGTDGGGGFGRNRGGLISIAKGDSIEILDDAGAVLAATAARRTADYVFYSSAALQSGRTYTLRVGGREVLTAEATAEGSSFTGLPDMDGGGQGSPGGQRPEDFNGQRPEGMPEGELPEGFEPPEGFSGERPEGMPEPPEGFSGELPEGFAPPEGFSGMPGGGQRPGGFPGGQGGPGGQRPEGFSGGAGDSDT